MLLRNFFIFRVYSSTMASRTAMVVLAEQMDQRVRRVRERQHRILPYANPVNQIAFFWSASEVRRRMTAAFSSAVQ